MKSGWEPADVDLNVPSAARMYDYYLGGKNHFAVDRERAEQVIQHFPQVRDLARANRVFLGAAVRAAAEAGVSQFIDLGAGLPTQGHVHEVANPIRPDTRVVYVDIDPIACVHARALLPDDTTAVVNADIRAPAGILEDPEVQRLIDWSKPVALLLVSVLHFISDDEDPAGIIGTFARHMTSGSLLVLATAADADDPVDTEPLAHAYRGSGMSPGGTRNAKEIHAFFEGFQLIPPGLVDAHDWPTPASYHWPAAAIRLLAGVGRRP
jgi:O-methyltransferase involved in polyketide biosynthesis